MTLFSVIIFFYGTHIIQCHNIVLRGICSQDIPHIVSPKEQCYGFEECYVCIHNKKTVEP